MSQATKTFSVNGNVNLMTALIAQNFKGTARVYTLFISNENDVPLYVNLTDTALTAPPSPATSGKAVGNLEKSTEYKITDAETDAGLIWLYSASAITVKVTVTGYGI